MDIISSFAFDQQSDVPEVLNVHVNESKKKKENVI